MRKIKDIAELLLIMLLAHASMLFLAVILASVIAVFAFSATVSFKVLMSLFLGSIN